MTADSVISYTEDMGILIPENYIPQSADNIFIGSEYDEPEINIYSGETESSDANNFFNDKKSSELESGVYDVGFSEKISPQLLKKSRLRWLIEKETKSMITKLYNQVEGMVNKVDYLVDNSMDDVAKYDGRIFINEGKLAELKGKLSKDKEKEALEEIIIAHELGEKLAIENGYRKGYESHLIATKIAKNFLNGLDLTPEEKLDIKKVLNEYVFDNHVTTAQI